MARINVKYTIGTPVKTTCKGGPEGLITAVFIRGKNRAYEFSYIDNNGNPNSVTVEETEIRHTTLEQPIGFNKPKTRIK